MPGVLEVRDAVRSGNLSAAESVAEAFRQLKNGPDPKFELPTKMSERTLNQITAMENALVRLQGFTANQASLLQPPGKAGIF